MARLNATNLTVEERQRVSEATIESVEFWSEGLAFFVIGLMLGVFFHEWMHYLAARKVGDASINWVALNTEYAIPPQYEVYVRRAPIYLGIFAAGLSVFILAALAALTPVPRSSIVIGVSPWVPCVFFGLPGDLRVPERA